MVYASVCVWERDPSFMVSCSCTDQMKVTDSLCPCVESLLFLWSRLPQSGLVCVCVCGWLRTLAQTYTDILPFDPLVSYHWSNPTYSAREIWSPNKKQRREKGENERNGTVFTADTSLSLYLYRYFIFTHLIHQWQLFAVRFIWLTFEITRADKQPQKCCWEIEKVLWFCI